MREATCEACKSSVPTIQSFSVAAKTLCEPCLKSLLAESSEGFSKDSIRQNVDPTVCVHCQADNGHDNWPEIAGLPACTKCEELFRNRPYPTWLKASFA